MPFLVAGLEASIEALLDKQRGGTANVSMAVLTFVLDGVEYKTNLGTSPEQLIKLMLGQQGGDGGGGGGGGGQNTAPPRAPASSGGGGGDGPGVDASRQHRPPPPQQPETRTRPTAPAVPADNAGIFDQAVDADGNLAGATPDHHQDNVVQGPNAKDSGRYYREKDWQQLVMQKDQKVGPRQIPLQERVTLSERAEVLKASREAVRVNPKSDGRGYDIGGVETKTFIDPARNLDEWVPGEDTAPKPVPLPPKAIESTVLFETVAMGSKLRNTHKVGGERVKEMDHFVASVETPRVITKIPDIAPYVIEQAMEGAEPVRVARPAGVAVCAGAGAGAPVDLYVQSKFKGADGGVAGPIAAHAHALSDVVGQLMQQVLQRDPGLVRIFYIVTLRADDSVCAYSKQDAKVWANALAFQQSQSYDDATGTLKPGVAKRTYTYWVQRLAMQLGRLDAAAGKPDAPTGLYDRGVRQRFRAFLQAVPN